MIDIKVLHRRVFEFLSAEQDKNTDFLFTLSNKTAQYQKGLFFDGTDTHLHFTCWHSRDNDERKPSVYLTISTDGAMFLNFIAKNPAWKRSYFEELTQIVGARPGPIKDDNGETTFWRKHYPQKVDIDEILAILKYQFIMADYKLINTFVESEQKPALLPLLNNTEVFNKFKSTIHSVIAQESIPDIEVTESVIQDKTIRLNSVVFNNIGIFSDVNMVFSNRLTCIIGTNGTGKTTILRSIALGLVGFSNNNVIGKNADALEQIQYMLKIKGVNGGNKGRVLYYDKAQIDLNYTLGTVPKRNRVFIECEEGEQEPTIYDDDGADFEATDGTKLQSLVIAFPQIQTKQASYVRENNSPDPLLHHPRLCDLRRGRAGSGLRPQYPDRPNY